MSEQTENFKGRILSGEREVSQAQLLGNVARAAAGFAAAGICFEDTVAIMLRNDFPFFEASMAASRISPITVRMKNGAKPNATGWFASAMSAIWMKTVICFSATANTIW